MIISSPTIVGRQQLSTGASPGTSKSFSTLVSSYQYLYNSYQYLYNSYQYSYNSYQYLYNSYQSVTNVFKYLNILVMNIYSDIRFICINFFYEYIQTFLRMKFLCTNIFGHSFVIVLACKS